MNCGRRKEIVLVDNFKLGKAAGSALLQSRYWVESAPSQNFFSSTSLLNSGISLNFFCLFIYYLLLFIHATGGNYSNVVLPQRKNYEQKAVSISIPQSEKSFFVLGMFCIAYKQ